MITSIEITALRKTQKGGWIRTYYRNTYNIGNQRGKLVHGRKFQVRTSWFVTRQRRHKVNSSPYRRIWITQCYRLQI